LSPTKKSTENISTPFNYGYKDTVSLTPYEEGVTKSAVVAAPDSGVKTILTRVRGTRVRPGDKSAVDVFVAPTQS
jgi:hypothetical protein